jgi:hypothetical protein
MHVHAVRASTLAGIVGDVSTTTAQIDAVNFPAAKRLPVARSFAVGG